MRGVSVQIEMLVGSFMTKLDFLQKSVRNRRSGLLASVSLAAVFGSVLTVQATLAQSQPAFTPSWSVGGRQAAAAGGQPVSATTTFTEAQARQTQATKANLERAAKSFRDFQTTQTAARAAAIAATGGNASTVVNGLNPRGLWLSQGDNAPYTLSNNANAADGLVWVNAQRPTETRNADGTVEVTVQQTASRAVLTWQNFDIGKETALTFQQRDPAGAPLRDWVAFNRVVAGKPGADGARAQAAPSQILGKIRADGQVYVINPNGIIFGGSSQTNSSALVASSLDIGLPYQTLAERNAYLLENVTGKLRFSAQLLFNTDQATIDEFGKLKQIVLEKKRLQPGGTYAPNDPRFVTITTLAVDKLEGDVTVAAGASLSTNALSANNSDLGRIVLAAPNVTNKGTLSTPDGQSILVGARNFSLAANNGTASIEAARFNLVSDKVDYIIPKPPGIAAIDPDLRGVFVTIGEEDLDTASGAGDPYVFAGGSIRSTLFGGRVSTDGGLKVTGIAQQCFIGRCAESEPFAEDKRINLDFSRRVSLVDGVTGNSTLLYAGSVTNTGLISSPRGAITVRANKILNDGVLHSTTSVNQNGLIDLAAKSLSNSFVTLDTKIVQKRAEQFIASTVAVKSAPELVLGPQSVISIQPDTQVQVDGTQKTIPSDAVSAANFRPSTVRLTAIERATENIPLTFTKETPKISVPAILGNVTLKSGSLVSAPSANVTIVAGSPGSIFSQRGTIQTIGDFVPNLLIENGATIDVAGLPDVELPLESHLVTVPRVGQNELADSPLQRNEFIYRKSVVVDSRISGTRDDGTVWRGTPLFDASGYINSRPRLVTELMTAGGKLNFGGAALIESGSLLNVAGGYLRYKDGFIKTTKLVSADGNRIFDISKASPLLEYSGFAGSETYTVPRWGVTRTFTDVGQSVRGTFEQGYVEGASAGSIQFLDEARIAGTGVGGVTRNTSAFLNNSRITSLAVMDGTIYGAAITGPNQRRGGTYFDASKALPAGATLDMGNVNTNSITFAKSANSNFSNVTAGSELVTTAFLNPTFSTDALSESGIQSLVFGKRTGGDSELAEKTSPYTYTRNIIWKDDAALALPDGGSVTLRAVNIDFSGKITAHGGTAAFSLLAVRPNLDLRYLDSIDSINKYGNPDLMPRSTLRVADSALIDVSGNWINDFAAAPSGSRPLQNAAANYLNGGSILIKSINPTPETVYENVYTVDLAEGAQLNLNSGGYVQANGRLATSSTSGLPLGRGGNLTVAVTGTIPAVYVPLDTSPTAELNGGLPNEAINDIIRINSRIEAFGFQGGGTFTLTAPHVHIGNTPSTLTKGVVNLTPAFFNEYGFGSFDLTAALTSKVAANTNLVLRQKLWLPTENARSAFSVRDGAALSSLTTDLGLQRPAVNLALRAIGASDLFSNNEIILGGEALLRIETRASMPGRNALILEAGSHIIGDPQAVISLKANGQLSLLGDISAPGGAVSLIQSSKIYVSRYLGAAVVFTRYTDEYLAQGVDYLSLFLGQEADINVSGTFVQDLRQSNFRTGNLLPGGSIAISAAIAAAAPGATMTASGASARIETRADARQNLYVSTDIYSDAGKIALSGLSTSFAARLSAVGGGARSAGGTLEFGGGAIVQTYVPVSSAITPYANFTSDVQFNGDDLLPGTAYISTFAADLLNNSGIDSLAIRTGGLLSFDGSSVLKLGRSLSIAAGTISHISSRSGLMGKTVELNAPYIRFTQLEDATPAIAVADSRLSVSGQLIDFVGVTRFTTSNLAFSSLGDIRFLPQQPITSFPDSGNGYNYDAGVTSNGNILFSAAQLYPATNVRALIKSTSQTGVVEFARNGAIGETPLSAGGRLIVTADTIKQNGVLRAPLGEITLGLAADQRSLLPEGEKTFVPTRLVSTGADSLTSVAALTLAGKPLQIPFGETVNGLDWFYRGRSITALTAAPAKQIRLNAANVDLSAGGTLDLSGGGDIVATEFIPGLGGQRNILQTSLTRDAGAPVYTIVPGNQPFAAPVDPQGYSNLVPDAVGQSITLLSDVPSLGLEKGKSYTLLPGNYATLPGAIRVQALPAATRDSAPNTQFQNQDGSIVVAGTYGVSGTSIDTSRTIGFNLMSRDVWQQYSEIKTTLGTPFFTAQAKERNTPPAALPADAGRLAFTVAERILTGAQLRFDLAEGGRGGLVDLSAPKIAVVSPELTALGTSLTQSGYLVLTPQDVRQFNASSLLLGATRSNSILGDTLTIGASDIRIATTAASPLSNPELLFASKANITIDPGSAIAAVGSIQGAASQNILVGRAEKLDIAGFVSVSGMSGDGAVVRLSNGTFVDILRTNVPAAPIGQINVGINAEAGVGASLNGGKILQLDAANTAIINTNTVLGGEVIDLFSSRLSFVTTAQQNTANIGTETLQILGNAKRLTFRASESIFFENPLTVRATAAASRFDALTLDTPNIIANNFAPGGALNFDATRFVYRNSYKPATVLATSGNAVVQATADTIVLTGNDRVVQGFNRFDLAATKTISLGDGGSSGVFKAPIDMQLTTPLLTLAQASDQSFIIDGSFKSLTPGSTAVIPDTDEIGGRLRVSAAAIEFSNAVSARAGIIDLLARTGDITVASTGYLQATGYKQSFTDKDVLLPGGKITAVATNGSFNLLSGGRVDVAAVSDGNAGSLSITTGAAGQQLRLDGQLLGQSGGGKTDGGSFLLDSRSRVDLDPLVSTLATAGFSKQVGIRGVGDLTLTRDITAQSVSLIADDDGAGGGRLLVGSKIDASGKEGGKIDLFGFTGVDLQSSVSLIARAQDASQRGGVVTIGTTLTSALNVPQAQATGGAVTLAAGSSIDVSDGADYGLYGGSGGASVTVRAPILTRNGDKYIPVTLDSTITGERSVTVEGFQRYTTSDPTSGFDGIIDPAGWFDSSGNYVTGQWLNIFGANVSATDRERAYFTTTPNQAHINFYQNSLVNFVQNPGVTFVTSNASINATALKFRPGVELVNGDTSINAGNISILSNWNLGAGTRRPDGSLDLVYRTTATGDAGVLTLRAANNILTSASIGDGFFRSSDSLATPFQGFEGGRDSQVNAARTRAFYTFLNLRNFGFFALASGFNSNPSAPVYINPDNASEYEIGTYNRLYFEYVARAHLRYIGDVNRRFGQYRAIKGAPQPPVDVATLAEYPNYLLAYNRYLDDLETFNSAREAAGLTTFVRPQAADAPSARNFGLLPTTSISNNIANNATYFDQNPLGRMDLNSSGDSWSYRFASGADVRSANPLALAQDVGATVTISTPPPAGSFILGGAPSAAAQLGQNDMIRTGTGSISIHAAGDVRLLNVTNTIYTAGIASTSRIDPVTGTRFVDEPLLPATRSPKFDPELSNKGDPNGYSVDVIGLTPTARGLVATKAVFPEKGGDISVLARGKLAMNVNFSDKVFLSTNRSEDIGGDPTTAITFNLPIVNYLSYAQNSREWMFRQGFSNASPSLNGQFGGTSVFKSTLVEFLNIDTLQSAQWIKTGLFQQGMANLGGGNMSVQTGGDVLNASLSVVSTYQATGGKAAGEAVGLLRHGGGNLSVSAGGDISSSKFMVSKGNATLTSGGGIVENLSGFSRNSSYLGLGANPYETEFTPPVAIPVENQFLLGDGVLDVQARRAIDMGFVGNSRAQYKRETIPATARLSAVENYDVFAPTFTDYASTSAARFLSVTGDIRSANGGDNLPGTLSLAAVRGSITLDKSINLAASPTGNLDLLAFETIKFTGTPVNLSGLIADSLTAIEMQDIDPAFAGTPLHPLVASKVDSSDTFRSLRADFNDRFDSHAASLLHKNDKSPAYIVALKGDIINGAPANQYSVDLPKQARIFAGRDIIDLSFAGQNLRNSDITTIEAGRDISYTLTTGYIGSAIGNSKFVSIAAGGFYSIGGPGQFSLIAGRNLDIAPGLAANVKTRSEIILAQRADEPDLVSRGNRTAPLVRGVLAVGNGLNGFLPAKSADINLLFGVGNGINVAGFVDRYINPANSSAVPANYSKQLVAYMNEQRSREARELDPNSKFVANLSADEAWQAFRLLDEGQQRRFVEEVLFSEIRVAADQKNFPDDYQNFPRVYKAIETLFPTANGYSDNSVTPSRQVSTGNLDMLGSTVRTDYDSDINVLGPGGSAILGGLVVDPRPQGILTARGGDVNIFTDINLLVNSSRIFTLQGGDISIFSSSGNIDAGRGRKTTAFFPPLAVNYSPTSTASINSAGLVTGAGIGTLLTVPGSATGDVFLLAPRGDIDAGDAGIRASGNLFVVAQRVLNADNIQVGGKSFGVPQVPVVVTSNLTSNSAIAGGLDTIEPAAGGAGNKGRSITQITVQVTGFGEPEEVRRKRKAKVAGVK
jgi:filamentous hemagglutinin family protein